jgi:hypothetical protein
LSKTTKRVALALVLLCLTLGGTALYQRKTGSSHEATQSTAAEPSTPIATAPTSAAPTPAAPPGDRAAAVVAQPEEHEAREHVRREPREERSAHRKKSLAMAGRASAIRESQSPAAAPPAEPPTPQSRRGNVAIEVRPKLGDAVQSFEIVKVAASVDGHEVSALDGKSFGQRNNEVQAWNGTVEAGEHVLNVVVEYHGNGHKVFSYFNGYRYTARSSTHFRVDEGGRLQMVVDLVDTGGVNTAFEKRLAIAFAARP